MYGGRFGAAIINNAVGGMSGEDKAEATSGRKPSSGYGYMETELFAELYEASYDSADNPTDRPFDPVTRKRDDGSTVEAGAEVQVMLEGIREAFEPSIAQGLIKSVALRVELDGFIKPEVKARFRHYVKVLFGDILPPWSAPREPAS